MTITIANTTTMTTIPTPIATISTTTTATTRVTMITVAMANITMIVTTTQSPRPRRGAVAPRGPRRPRLGEVGSVRSTSLLRFVHSIFPGNSPMDMTIPPLRNKHMIESNPLRSRILIWKFAVLLLTLNHLRLILPPCACADLLAPSLK